MIVAPLPGRRLRLVTQGDHAHLAAGILGLWREDKLPEHPRRSDLLFAAREHDNGWREHDAAPRIRNDTGRPHDFRSTPGSDRRPVWVRGTARHVATRPYAALLIVEHARLLHAGLREDSSWQPILADWDAQRADLLEQTGTPHAALEADYRFVEHSDALSLALAERWPSERPVRGIRIVPRLADRPSDVDALALAPFPLAGSTTFTLPYREIEDRRYQSDSDLAVTLAEARWQEARVRLVPREDTV